MWTSLAHKVIKYRFYFILAIVVVTAFMGYFAKDVELSYDFSRVVPPNDPDMAHYQRFKSLYGEEGEIIVIGARDSSLFTPENFRRFAYLTDELSRLKGVEGVLALPRMQALQKDTENRKFRLQPLFNDLPDDQRSLDSLMRLAREQKFYSGRLFNENTGATLLVLTVDKEIMRSNKRVQFTEDILQTSRYFEDHTGITLHHAGLPFIRTIVS